MDPGNFCECVVQRTLDPWEVVPLGVRLVFEYKGCCFVQEISKTGVIAEQRCDLQQGDILWEVNGQGDHAKMSEELHTARQVRICVFRPAPSQVRSWQVEPAGSIVPASASQCSGQWDDRRTQGDVYAGGLFEVAKKYDSGWEPQKGYLSPLWPGEIVRVERQWREEGVAGEGNLFDSYVYGTREDGGQAESGWFPVAILGEAAEIC